LGKVEKGGPNGLGLPFINKSGQNLPILEALIHEAEILEKNYF